MCDRTYIPGLLAFQSADLGPRWEGEPVCYEPIRTAVGNLIWVKAMARPGIANAMRVVARQGYGSAERT